MSGAQEGGISLTGGGSLAIWVKRQHVRLVSPSLPAPHFLFLLLPTLPCPAVLGSVKRTRVAWSRVRAGTFPRRREKGATWDRTEQEVRRP